MGSLISTFHIDVRLIIAQLVNFIIVMLVLWFFALKPLIKMMGERTEKIEKSLLQAKEIEVKMTATQAEQAAILKQAKQDAAAVLEAAKASGEDNRQQMLQKTKEEVEKIVVKGKEQLAAEKVKMVGEIKGEIADLVIATTKKVLGSAVTKEVDKKLVNEAIKDLK